MKNEELGIDDRGIHNPQLTPLERECIDILQQRGAGARSAISANALACRLLYRRNDEEAGEPEPEPELVKRQLRRLINHLIMSHEVPIICQAGALGGYFLAGEPAEVEAFHRTFHRRAMTGLLKASRGKKAAFVQILAQLSLGFDDPASREVIESLKLTPDEDPVPAWVQVTTKLLDRISQNPQRYAAEIRRLQEAYGEIFVPRDKVRALKIKTEEFRQLLSEIA